METKRTAKTIEVVVQGEGAGGLMWGHDGTVYIGTDHAALGRFAVTLATDDATPSVPFESPTSKMMRAASDLLGAVGAPTHRDGSDACAVHLVIQVTEDDDGAIAAAVFPPHGRCRMASGVEALGALLVELASDESQPRVAAGAPPDGAAEIAQRGIDLVGAYLRGEA